MVTINVNGGCHGNGTENAVAYGSYRVMDPSTNLDQTQRLVLNGAAHTNNEAEYATLIAALDYAKREHITARVLTDSALVVNQVAGK